jgi:hypothetical protein
MKLLKGCIELIESPSGVFSLLCLLVIAFVTLKQPAVGGAALAAFCAAVPAILSWTENRETMVQLQSQQPPSPSIITVPQPPVNVANPAPPTDPTSV